MKFTNAAVAQSVIWQCRLADWPRSQQRARINSLVNGSPPYSAHEVKSNGISINVNFLESTRLSHDARLQFYNAMMKPGNYFSATTEFGPVHKRQEWNSIVTREMNAVMKKSLKYFEKHRSTFASVVLHGIGPSTWRDRHSWCPDARGVEDVMIPSNTLLTMENLPFFAVFEPYTAFQLHKLTHGPKVDPGWNMPLVDQMLKWADSETQTLMGSSWPEVWSPEKMTERIKEDSGLYASDRVPTIDCWHLYYWDDSNKKAGWRKKVILDAYGAPGIGGVIPGSTASDGKYGDYGKNAFLYDSGNRCYGSKREELIGFQFADLSAVAPFKYHSVRSLGYLIYAPCHLQNRLRCKFNEAVFEALMMYFRVKSMDEAERALKIDLINRGFIDETVEFVKPQDRWQVNADLVNLGLRENQNIIEQNSASYTSDQDFSSNNVEKTKFQVQAELSATTTLVTASLMQAYEYQKFEYYEIARRFFIRNSRDADVRQFRVRVLKQGVPENLLTVDAWNLEPERVMGGGNKVMELQIAQQLMQAKQQFDPQAQRIILKDFALAVTDDPARTRSLVPEDPQVNNPAVIQAQLASGTLMQGMNVGLERGIDLVAYTESLLSSLAVVVSQVENGGNVPSQERLTGMMFMQEHIAQAIATIGSDPQEKQRVKIYNDDLAKLGNLIKAFSQRLAEKQSAGNGQSPEMAKMQAELEGKIIKAESDAKIREAKAIKQLEQKDRAFASSEQRAQDAHKLELARRIEEAETETAIADLKGAAEIRRQPPKATAE